MKCTFCNKKVDRLNAYYTEDAEPAHKFCLEETENWWKVKWEYGNLLGY